MIHIAKTRSASWIRAPATRSNSLDDDELPFRRALANYLDLWVECPREKCRVTGACRGRLAPCYDERRPEIIEAMTSLLHDGYITEDGELL